eukprot:CCRYP_021081-RA/>CCRYP_021081-RA protein AED:0.45 eAED:0.50 QI:0/-1/0/1/-1/1/1/0/116
MPEPFMKQGISIYKAMKMREMPNPPATKHPSQARQMQQDSKDNILSGNSSTILPSTGTKHQWSSQPIFDTSAASASYLPAVTETAISPTAQLSKPSATLQTMQRNNFCIMHLFMKE